MSASGGETSHDARAVGDLPIEVLQRALAGDVGAIGEAIDAFTPLVQVRVFRALVRRARAAERRDVRQEIEDLTQEVLCLLFADDAKILRMWDPARGLSLRNYVGLIAERETSHALKSGRRTPWALTPTEDDALAPIVDADRESPEGAFASKEIVAQVWARIEAELSPKGLVLLQRLIVDEQPAETLAVELAMTTDAVYAWKSRLAKRLRALATEVSSDSVSRSPDARPTPLRRPAS